MSDSIKHECGIAVIRLRKPLQYYIDKYGTPLYAANKLYLLMEKQHNRGQDGAGVINIKLDMPPGYQYIFRHRSIETAAIADIFKKVQKSFTKGFAMPDAEKTNADWLKLNVDYSGEVWLGHLRYGTHGENTIEACHPMLRLNNWRSRNLAVAGNFNMTNVEELFNKLVDLGQNPKEKADTVTVMEKIGHFLDEEVQRQFDMLKPNLSNKEISDAIEDNIDLQRVLQRSCRDFDGGYAMAGLTGYGGLFVARDPSGIRPAYYYADEEVVVIASEKPAIKTAFGIEYSEIKEIEPGHALIVDKAGEYAQKQFTDPREKLSCSFERIYFSRGTDPDIYRERKTLGKLLVPQILEAIDYDIEHTVFSYIPNTAETAFLGMVSGIEAAIMENPEKFGNPNSIAALKPRVEKLVIKDAKLRTFITDDAHRDDLVSHVYDTTYEVIEKGVDTIVVIDDSIVRGTTLEKSILTMLNRLGAKRVIIVSSAPQIRYPDCYGIDMSKVKEFVAFRAMIALIKETGKEALLEEVYQTCKTALATTGGKEANYVKPLFDSFGYEEVSKKIAEIVTPAVMTAEVKVVYQTIENLHIACPDHKGDWYFTGNYPTEGGNRVVNQAFVNFMEGKSGRAY
jgi:amidophosphoribosyltransferase